MATREQIQEYLDIRDKIDMTVNAVLNKHVSIDTIPEGEEKNMIKLTVATVKKRNKHLHKKEVHQAAINEYRITEYSNPNAIKEVADNYKLKAKTFDWEIYKHSANPNYVFTKGIEGEHISYAQDEELWQYLKSLVERDFLPCSCRACFLLASSEYAYKFVKWWKIDRLPRWYLRKAASIEWIQKFEMRHRCEISDLCMKSCNKYSCNVSIVIVSAEPVCSTSTSNQ